jgi:hypothetical protein
MRELLGRMVVAAMAATLAAFFAVCILSYISHKRPEPSSMWLEFTLFGGAIFIPVAATLASAGYLPSTLAELNRVCADLRFRSLGYCESNQPCLIFAYAALVIFAVVQIYRAAVHSNTSDQILKEKQRLESEAGTPTNESVMTEEHAAGSSQPAESLMNARAANEVGDSGLRQRGAGSNQVSSGKALQKFKLRKDQRDLDLAHDVPDGTHAAQEASQVAQGEGQSPQKGHDDEEFEEESLEGEEEEFSGDEEFEEELIDEEEFEEEFTESEEEELRHELEEEELLEQTEEEILSEGAEPSTDPGSPVLEPSKDPGTPSDKVGGPRAEPSNDPGTPSDKLGDHTSPETPSDKVGDPTSPKTPSVMFGDPSPERS